MSEGRTGADPGPHERSAIYTISEDSRVRLGVALALALGAWRAASVVSDLSQDQRIEAERTRGAHALIASELSGVKDQVAEVKVHLGKIEDRLRTLEQR